jgi:uncharacterized caspase-like protein
MYYFQIPGTFLLALTMSRTIDEPLDRNHKVVTPRLGRFAFLPILFFLFVFINVFDTHAKLYAVCVGVSQYEQSLNNLEYSHQDAIEMYEMLKLQAPVNQLRLLTDQQATADNIVSTTKALFSQARAEDIVIFFFSGHGNKNYFKAHDKPLYFKILKSIFKQTKAKRKIVFADACYVGSLRTSKEDAANNRVSVGDNVLLFLSSRSNQTSMEMSRLKNGVFTYFLLAGLKGGADNNKDRVVTARELFDFVNPKVTERSGGSQVPVMWGKFEENMTLLIWKKNE